MSVKPSGFLNSFNFFIYASFILFLSTFSCDGIVFDESSVELSIEFIESDTIVETLLISDDFLFFI